EMRLSKFFRNFILQRKK
nr:Chain A, Competence-stimulating peptide type 1 [Streptococcus pneumoniae]